MITAFQANAFQDNGFQIEELVVEADIPAVSAEFGGGSILAGGGGKRHKGSGHFYRVDPDNPYWTQALPRAISLVTGPPVLGEPIVAIFDGVEAEGFSVAPVIGDAVHAEHGSAMTVSEHLRRHRITARDATVKVPLDAPELTYIPGPPSYAKQTAIRKKIKQMRDDLRAEQDALALLLMAA